MPKQDKEAKRVKQIFDRVNGRSRAQWEYINQKGFDFSNDNQLSEQERISLEEQGMPTFTINRIMPVVEMLNFYATAKSPRWQAVGVTGDDTDVAAVFADMADYVWSLSDGSTLYSNAVNDAITKSVGYLMVTVDPDSDNGMGDVVIKQPEPFDVYIDPKSRDLLFRDAAFVLIRKLLPTSHLKQLYPDHVRKINAANSDQETEFVYSEKSQDSGQKDFSYKDISGSESVDPEKGEDDKLLELFELYEKVQVPYVNIFYKIPPSAEEVKLIKQQVAVKLQELQAEMSVQLKEQDMKMQAAVQEGKMLPERYQLEIQKAQKLAQAQLQAAQEQFTSQLQAEVSKIENKVVTRKEMQVLMKDPTFVSLLVDQVPFHRSRIKLTCIVGDKTIYSRQLPHNITHYPIVPIHFKWTGTPFPISAVSPLIGKQRELNKAHQLMVHNASLGSSLRWMHEEGSIDTDHWEQYASSPGALLPIRPGAVPPTAVQPAPLSNAFFGIVQEGKQDMEYLAGIYGAMQGDTGSQHDTYRGMLAQDEYGTRRVKQWLKNAVEPGLKQLGEVVKEFTQSVYTAHKVFRVIQPEEINGEKDVEINIPLYNDMGEAIGKWKDYATAKFDVRIVQGSTLPVNRWAYLEELKNLMQLGVVDDIAVLAETDIKNKDKIVQRKSMLAQMQKRIQSMEEEIKNANGTIETLERQVVQSGIKGKVMQAEMEVNKSKAQAQSGIEKEVLETKAQQKVLRESQKAHVGIEKEKFRSNLNDVIKDLQKSKETS
jgi:hypothetical protein